MREETYILIEQFLLENLSKNNEGLFSKLTRVDVLIHVQVASMPSKAEIMEKNVIFCKLSVCEDFQTFGICK